MADHSSDSEAGAPRWVKVLGILTTVLILMGLGHFFTGGGAGFHALPSAAENGEQP